MLIELTGFKKYMFYLAAILIGFCGMAEMGVNPAINGIFETYGFGLEGSFAVSAPTWSMALFAFLCVPLMAKITKKKLLIAGVAVFTVGALCAPLVPNFYYYFVMRLLMGAGEGITNTVILAYLAQMFIDQGKHATFVGIWNFVYTAFGAVLSVVGGYFAVPEWTGLFVVFSPAVVILVTTIVFLPEIGMETEPTPLEGSGAAVKADAADNKLGGLFWAFWASFMIFSLGVAVYMYFLSELVEVTGLGSYDLTGMLMMVYMIGGMLISLVFGKLFMVLKKWFAVINIILLAVGLAMLYFFQGNLAVAYVASFIIGVAFGAQYPYMYTMVVDVAPAAAVDRGIGFITGGYSVMYILISYIVNFLRPILSPEMQVVTPQFLAFAIFMLVALVIEIVTMPAYKKHMAEVEAAQGAGQSLE